MEGIKTDVFVDCERNMFGSEVDTITVDDKKICFIGPTFKMCETQETINKLLNLYGWKVVGVEFIKKQKQTTNWFEKVFLKKQECIRMYVEEGGKK